MKINHKKLQMLIDQAEDKLDKLEKDKQRTIGEIGAYQALRELIEESDVTTEEPPEIPLDPDNEFEPEPIPPIPKKNIPFWKVVILICALIVAIAILIGVIGAGLL